MRTVVLFAGAGCSSPLGYPTWKELAEKVLETTLKLAARDPGGDGLDRFENFFQRLQIPESVKSDDLLFILGECQRILQWQDVEGFYWRLMQDLFKPISPPAGVPNPYWELLDLPIYRFVTSNYDHEIERALVEKRKMPADEFGFSELQPDSRRRTFTQRPEYQRELAVFVLGRMKEAENTVFHCHGSYKEPESLVVTEADYQKWYLADREGACEFRQAVELLFGSNPVLFVGFGLGDEDLLRPLRRFVAVEPGLKTSRPIFALLPEESDGEDWNLHEQLFDRYGVNVIPFLAPRDGDSWARGRALCEAIMGLKEYWLNWRRGWLCKPAIRRVKGSDRRARIYKHYWLTPNRKEVFGGERVSQYLDTWQELLAKGEINVLVLVGPGGTGKSWHAMRLLERLERHSDFQKLFFWSSYYADDSLTGLDRALRFLDPAGERIGSRLERFCKCLQEGRNFLIFDGIERFLRETGNPDHGEASTWATREFLKVVSNPSNQSAVLLTTRLWPEVFGSPEPEERRILRCHLPRMGVEDLDRVEPFSGLPREEVSALCSLLDGHSFGLRLAAQVLRARGSSEFMAGHQRLRQVLTDTWPDRRISRVIGQAIDTVDKPWDGLAMRLLERLAVFMSPVGEGTLEICYRLAKNAAGGGASDREECGRIVNDLLSSHLLYRIATGDEEAESVAFTVHPTVRGYVFQRIHETETDALPNFILPGFTAGTSIVDPGSEKTVEVISRLFDSLCDDAEVDLQNGRDMKARRLCRSAFGVVRSRMGAVTAPRWGSYSEYIRLVVRLANLAKKVSPRLWDYAARRDVRTVEDADGPLYADELAWLYNEIGLSYYSEGSMLDSLAVWEQGYEINKFVDSIEGGGPFSIQSSLNLGAAMIEFGRLNVADGHLRDAERANFRLLDDDLAGRIAGYQALVQHLRGDLIGAGILYETAIRKLASVPNPRAESVFLRHQADLQICLDDLKGARRSIDASRAAAETARYPDLIAYSRCTSGHLWRMRRQHPRALREYEGALQVARSKGIRKLEADLLSELSRLALDLGDARLAQQRAMESLRIANELNLGLRKAHGLVVLGLASVESGQRRLGIAYLEHARTLADSQEYWLRGREAEEHLRRLGAAKDQSGRLD